MGTKCMSVPHVSHSHSVASWQRLLGGIVWLPTIKRDTWNQSRPLKCLPVSKIQSMHQVDVVQKLRAMLQMGNGRAKGNKQTYAKI